MTRAAVGAGDRGYLGESGQPAHDGRGTPRRPDRGMLIARGERYRQVTSTAGAIDTADGGRLCRHPRLTIDDDASFATGARSIRCLRCGERWCNPIGFRGPPGRR